MDDLEPKEGVEPDPVTDEEDLSHLSGLQRFGRWAWEILRTWGPAITIMLVVRSSVAEPFRIPSGSMVPTLEIGDHILVTKYSYGFRIPLTRIPVGELQVPARGDIVVFVYPGSDEGVQYWMDLPVPPFATYDYVKRVVGLPGDTIEVRNNVVYVNGEAQGKTAVGDHTFVDDQCRAFPTREFQEQLGSVQHPVLNSASYVMRAGDFPPTKVPEGHIFAMGDNRDHSSDSRVWGFVPLRNIKGKARLVWLSYDHCNGNIPFIGSFRGDRFGSALH